MLRRHCGTVDEIWKIGGSARKITRDIGQDQKKPSGHVKKTPSSVKNVQGHDGKNNSKPNYYYECQDGCYTRKIIIII